jgi:hypothetical protein
MPAAKTPPATTPSGQHPVSGNTPAPSGAGPGRRTTANNQMPGLKPGAAKVPVAKLGSGDGPAQCPGVACAVHDPGALSGTGFGTLRRQKGAVMAGTSKQLTCPQCEQVMAAAVFRVFGGLRIFGVLRITTPDGLPLSPVRDDLLLQIAEQHLASASAEDYPEAKRRRDAILRNAGDRFYDIKCPDGHYTLKTAPEITRAIRRAAGDQVSLA